MLQSKGGGQDSSELVERMSPAYFVFWNRGKIFLVIFLIIRYSTNGSGHWVKDLSSVGSAHGSND